MGRKEILERLKGTTGYVTINGRVYRETPATRAERAELKAEELEQENVVLKEDNALLWYNAMVAEFEIAELWYELMVAGGEQ